MSVSPPPPPEENKPCPDPLEDFEVYDVLIIGAGPCGLAVAARLCETTPSAIFTDEEHRRYQWIGKYGRKVPVRHNKDSGVSRQAASQVPGHRMIVLDSEGDDWMARWDRLFGAYGIENLRSPMFWHVDPHDRDSLLARAYEQSREHELVEIRGCVGKEISKHAKKKRAGHCGKRQYHIDVNERDRNDYFTPSRALFAEHCREVARRYHLEQGLVCKETVQDIDFGIVKGMSAEDERIFTVATNRTRRFARAVVLAVGPANVATVPRLPSMPPQEDLPQACHSMRIEQLPAPIVQRRLAAGRATNVLVVGGGLTSAQLSDLAIRKGVTRVWHTMRGPCRIKPFDVDLPWMGKFRNLEQARFWSADSDEERLDIIRAARGGGSITALFHKRLKEHMRTDRLKLLTETKLVDARFVVQDDAEDGGGAWEVVTEPPVADLPAFDYVYFATGVQTDFTTLPYLQNMLRRFPIQGFGGFPCLNDDLMWNDDVPLFVNGRLASLKLGPAGPNLGGARLGAERIAWSIEELFGESSPALERGVKQGSLAYATGNGSKYSSLFEASE